MKTGPEIDKTALIEKVSCEYDIDIEDITFLHKGFSGYCYIVDCFNRERYFLKLLEDSRIGRKNALQMDFYLPLTWNLHYKNILPNVPYPVKTRDGRFKAEFEGQSLVISSFINGEVIGCESPLPDDILAKLASLLGILHRRTYEIGIDFTYVERFDIPYEDELIDGLNALEGITAKDCRGKQELRRLLLPRRDEIIGYLNRLKELQKIARATRKDKVLCHTDLHGGNLIVGDQGELYILDWEGAMLAPPEHDLFFFAWEDRFMEIFFASYRRESGPVELNANTFGFYYYRRNLEDLTDWVIRILYENTEDEQDKRDLEGIMEDCVSGWPYLEDTISKISEGYYS